MAATSGKADMITQQARTRQSADPVIRHSHLSVLKKVQSGIALDSLGQRILTSLLNGKIGVCQEVKDLVKEMRRSGKL